MFDTEQLRKKVERALVIGIETPDMDRGEAEMLLEELEELVSNLDIAVEETKLIPIKKLNPSLLMGSGKADEMIEHVKKQGYDCIVFDNELSPAQQRNWEQASGLCVIDRQEVILDIFGERAQTKAATLQVELARLEYSLPRLRRAWTHLHRQRGGAAVQRGEGETQLEMDQRMVRKQIARVKEQLATVIKQRQTQRKQRHRIPLPTAAIVGYTNAGKSSLLKRLTESSNIQGENKLFATLDPKTRRMVLPSERTILFTDTVGFVKRLPHRLIEAFKATLEEAVVSDFLIHVIDVSNPAYEEQIQTTLEVLQELGVNTDRILTVYNKIDRIQDAEQLRMERASHRDGCFISTHTGEGLEELIQCIDQRLDSGTEDMRLLIPHDRYDLINQLHRAGAVMKEEAKQEGVYIHGHIPPRLRENIVPYLLTNGSINGKK